MMKKNKQNEGQQAGRRLRKAVDGPVIMEQYAKMPTAELARQMGLTVVNMLLGNPINPINCGAIAMLGGFPVVWITSLLTKKMDTTIVSKIFACYK